MTRPPNGRRRSAIDPPGPGGQRAGTGLDRRALLKLAAASAAGAAVGALGCGRPAVRNVLFIAIDDLNDWVGCLGGHPDALTPSIDRLAERGVLFNRAYSDGTNCNATRTAVLSGVAPAVSGVVANKQPFREHLPEAETLPERLRAAGLRVAGGGKLFHEHQPELFDTWFTPEVPDIQGARVDTDLWGYPGAQMLNWGPVALEDEEMWDGRLAAWAEGQLAIDDGRPFFLGVGFFAPHLPWLIPRAHTRLFKPGEVTLPEVLRGDMRDVPRYGALRSNGRDFRIVAESGQWHRAVAMYLAAIHFADSLVGRLLDALDRSPHRDTTAIVLWSDHGFMLGQKRRWHKYALWEQGVRVPLVVAAPGLTPEGARCGQPVSLVHLYPTLCDLVGVEPAATVTGRSLRPLLADPDSRWETPAISTLDYGSHAIRTERWRYIRYADGSEELYDHDNDPLEWNNLAASEDTGKIRSALAARLPGAAA